MATDLASMRLTWRLTAQGMMVAEVIMDHLACATGKSGAEIRDLNMYKEGETTHFGQILDGCQVVPHSTSSCAVITMDLPIRSPSSLISCFLTGLSPLA